MKNFKKTTIILGFLFALLTNLQAQIIDSSICKKFNNSVVEKVYTLVSNSKSIAS
jgi:hypothetical protein